MFTIHSFSIHFPFTFRSLSVHFPFTFCSLSVHFPFTFRSLSVHSIHFPFTFCSLSVHFPFTFHSLSKFQKLSPKIEIGKKYYTFRKCHRILRVFPKYDGLTPAQSLLLGLCTRALKEARPLVRSFLQKLI